MRAAVNRHYGPPDVVTIVEVPTPSPNDDEVLIQVRATTVTAGDWRLRTAIAPRGFGPLVRLGFGVFGPRKHVLGTEVAGEVAGVGKNVDRFAVGDRVFALCGANLGGHAEYVVLRGDGAIARSPSNLTDEEAAALSFGGSAALFFLRAKARVQPGESVLINGASGCVGAAAVQLAKHFGATVTGVCSAANADMVRALGAHRVIDYATEDFTKAGPFDVVMDTVGNCTFARCAPALADGGRLLLVAADLMQLLGAMLRPKRSGRLVLAGVAPERAEDLRFLADLAEAGAYRPFIDRTYPFERIVDAHAHVETHRKRGNVVVRVS